MSDDSTPRPNRAARRSRGRRKATALSEHLSIPETAEYLGVAERTVRVMIADGRLTAYRLGDRIIRLRRSEINAAMQPVD